MSTENSWGWFKNDPVDICENKIVADACFRGAPVKIISNDGKRALVEYKGERDYVSSDGLLDRPTPDFTWNDIVSVASKKTEARIVDICWHFNEQRYYYYLEDTEGKAIKRRYFGNELIGV